MTGWTSEVLAAIQSKDGELKAAVRQFRVIENTAPQPDYVYQSSVILPIHSQTKVRRLDSISESSYEDENMCEHPFSTANIKMKTSNASCHKRQRGLVQKLQPMEK